MTDKEKRFPVNVGRETYIPWSKAEEVYKEYSRQNGTSQSLERLAERGGFGIDEMITLLIQRIERLEGKEPKCKFGG